MLENRKRNRKEYELGDPTNYIHCIPSHSSFIDKNTHNFTAEGDVTILPTTKIIKRANPLLEDNLNVGKKVYVRVRGNSTEEEEELFVGRIYLKETFGLYVRLSFGKKVFMDDKHVDKFLTQWRGDCKDSIFVLDVVHEVL